jgi:hypothetical protein
MKKLMSLSIIILSCLVISNCSSSSKETNGQEEADNQEEDGGENAVTTAIIADHSVIGDFSNIPAAAIAEAIQNLHIYYGHTSHGSQLVTGAQMLQNTTYNWNSISIEEEYSDLGHNGDITWADTIRNKLDEEGSQINMVIWSWCGGASDNTNDGIDAYLNAMNALEGEFPDVTFVYMTGHTDGTGDDGTLRINNQRIRDYAEENNKTLFDFADVESYDPDGTYYEDTSDACDWCGTWCEGNICGPYSISCTDDAECAHSHCFNCYIKGKAFWWLLARIAGWEG